jgi:nucleotide-binding universal stress UspA family protein
MRDVLVHVRDVAHWGDIAAYAADLAARSNGTLTGVHVEPRPQPIAVPGSGVDVVVAAGRRVGVDAQQAAARFTAWAIEMGARRAAWQTAEGDLPNVLARLSAWHDLVVVDRNPHEPLPSVAELGEIVVTSRAPVILVPPRRREALLDCIAVAWNHSREALVSIHAARPLFAHATKIVLLEGSAADERVELGWNPKFDIVRYMDWQGFSVEREAIRGESNDAGRALVAAARRHRANLLVMGAYGRSRVSEWALGGTTRSVLFDASVPVFLKH